MLNFYSNIVSWVLYDSLKKSSLMEIVRLTEIVKKTLEISKSIIDDLNIFEHRYWFDLLVNSKFNVCIYIYMV